MSFGDSDDESDLADRPRQTGLTWNNSVTPCCFVTAKRERGLGGGARNFDGIKERRRDAEVGTKAFNYPPIGALTPSPYLLFFGDYNLFINLIKSTVPCGD